MSQQPYFGRIHEVPWTSYEYGAPVSAYRALVLRNNIQFCVNQITQHRVNWSSPVSPAEEDILDGFFVDTTGGAARTQTWSQEFPHTWINPKHPCPLDIKVVGFVGPGAGAALVVRVKVVPASAAINDPGAIAFFEAEATTTGASTEAVVEGRAQFFGPVGIGNLWQELSVFEGGKYRAPRVAMSRIEVQLICPADDLSSLRAVLVREYGWQTS